MLQSIFCLILKVQHAEGRETGGLVIVTISNLKIKSKNYQIQNRIPLRNLTKKNRWFLKSTTVKYFYIHFLLYKYNRRTELTLKKYRNWDNNSTGNTSNQDRVQVTFPACLRSMIYYLDNQEPNFTVQPPLMRRELPLPVCLLSQKFSSTFWPLPLAWLLCSYTGEKKLYLKMPILWKNLCFVHLASWIISAAGQMSTRADFRVGWKHRGRKWTELLAFSDSCSLSQLSCTIKITAFSVLTSVFIFKVIYF